MSRIHIPNDSHNANKYRWQNKANNKQACTPVVGFGGQHAALCGRNFATAVGLGLGGVSKVVK
jgi:hypothetical protein